MKSVTLKLPDLLHARLAAEARKRRATKSAVVNRALETLLPAVGDGHRRGMSCHDLARDLAGCCKGGPPDLSTNEKYMRGFGE